MPIVIPTPSPKRALFRKLVDVGIAAIPYVGTPLVAIYSLTHPSNDDVVEQRWREEISRLVNDTEAAVDFILKRVELSEGAAVLGHWLSEDAESGWDEIDDITPYFPDASESEIVEFLGELELEGLVRISHTVNSGGRVIIEPKLYEVFDPIVFEGIVPRMDAAVIARAVLSSRDTISIPALIETNGWTVRRANPAIAIIGEMIDDGRKSCPGGVDYRIWAITADAKERVRLRRFIDDVALRSP